MQFSDYYNVSEEIIKDYGAINISLICDIPLFIDPMLIFNSQKSEYQELHKEIIKYFHFLANKAQRRLTKSEVNTWFCFHEVCENWLGYSLSGNKGSALSTEFGQFLYENIGFVLNTHGISQEVHAEKIMLLYDKSGRDKISDMTVNLIKGFLASYTEKFAKKYLAPEFCKSFYVEKSSFNYNTESFNSEEFYLPFIVNEKGRMEYVLLTPADILREAEPAINRNDYYEQFDRVRASIDNDVLKTVVENYILNAVKEYEKERKANKKRITESGMRKIELQAFSYLTKEYPELYDYYVRLREADTEEIQIECMEEVTNQLTRLLINAKELISLFLQNGYEIGEATNAQEEAIKRIKYFKHIIEDCDGYRNFYVKGECIAREADLQRMFKFVWYGTSYKANFEVNNGRGPADVIVDKGIKNQCIIEFKLASNSRLAHVFEQVEIYEAANCSDGSLIVIFYFTEDEWQKSLRMIKNLKYEKFINKSIFLIDCRKDNKKSASVK